MSTTTKKKLNKTANLLEKCANGIINSLELLIRDVATPKRVRRIRR